MPYHFTLTAVTPEGYAFEGWYAIREDGQRTLLSVDDSYIGVMNDGDLHIVASFTKVCSVTVSIMGGGQVTNDTDGRTYDEAFSLTVAKGDTFTLSIPWSDEWALDGWYTVDEDGKLGHRFSVDSLECVFTATEDMHICAVFVPKYDLTIITENELGGFTVNWSEEVYTNWNANDVPPFTYRICAVEPVGYVFAGWYELVNGDPVLLTEDLAFEITVDGVDRRLYPAFVEGPEILFTVCIDNGEGGNVIVDGEDHGSGAEWMMPIGAESTFKIICDEGVTFKGWFLRTYPDDSEPQYTFYSIEEELTVTLRGFDGYYVEFVAILEGAPSDYGV